MRKLALKCANKDPSLPTSHTEATEPGEGGRRKYCTPGHVLARDPVRTRDFKALVFTITYSAFFGKGSYKLHFAFSYAFTHLRT